MLNRGRPLFKKQYLLAWKSCFLLLEITKFTNIILIPFEKETVCKIDPLPLHIIRVFLIYQKLLLWNFKTFILFLLATFSESSNVIVCVQHFLMQICWRWVQKNLFFRFTVFHLAVFKYLLKAKRKQTIPIINVKTKLIFIEKACKKRKNKEN